MFNNVYSHIGTFKFKIKLDDNQFNVIQRF